MLKIFSILTIPIALLLLGNSELGTVGQWADVCIYLIAAYWSGIYALIVWNEKEETKRQNRKTEKEIEKMLDYEYKREFIRDTIAA